MDLDLYDYERALGVKFSSTKAERDQTGESSMTDVMVITAAHLDANEKPVRYKVENSSGDRAGLGFLRYDRSVVRQVSYYDLAI